MANIEKLSIALPADMVAAIKEAVSSGDYATNSDVVRDALRDWRIRRHVENADTTELRRLVREGIASLDRGQGVPAKDVLARLKARYLAMAEKAEEETA
jgi:antitoxin ParD1/3/4